MPRNSKLQNTPTRVHVDKQNESRATNSEKIPDTPSTDATRTPMSTPKTSTGIYGDAFNFALSKIFTKALLASLTTKDAIFKTVRDCVLTNNEERCKQIRPNIHSLLHALHVKSGCFSIDNKIAIPHTIKEAYVDDIHSIKLGNDQYGRQQLLAIFEP